MARMARVVLPGYPHHVTQRGNRRQTVFFSNDDYRSYTTMVAEACRKARTAVWAYCLMPNHVHFVLVPSDEDGLCAVFAEAHRRYTRRMNLREGWQGHLWQERFYSCPMDETHLLATVPYVELNPVRAGLVRCAQDWPWSSARAHFVGEDDGLVHVSPMLERIPDWGLYVQNESSADNTQTLRQHTRSGRPLGEDKFIDMAERISGRVLRPRKRGPKRKPPMRERE